MNPVQIVCQKSFFCFFLFCAFDFAVVVVVVGGGGGCNVSVDDLADPNGIFDGDRDNKRTPPREEATVEEVSNISLRSLLFVVKVACLHCTVVVVVVVIVVCRHKERGF